MNKYIDAHGLHYFATKMHERFGTNIYNMKKIKNPLHQFINLADYQNGDLFVDGVCIYMKIGHELRKLTSENGYTYLNSLSKALIDLNEIMKTNEIEYDSSQWLALLEV